ncbi:MAG TPA: hypothetical protein PLK76_02320 [bacterium]|nr:hypothetical protein [bacterium]
MNAKKNNTRPRPVNFFLTREGLEKIQQVAGIPADLREKIMGTGLRTEIPMWQMKVWAERLRPHLPKGFNPFETRAQWVREGAAANLAAARKAGILPTSAPAPATARLGSERAKAANAAMAARYMAA